MADNQPDNDNTALPADEAVTAEIRNLAEQMITEVESGRLSDAVSVINKLNEIRDRTLYQEVGKLTRAVHESIKNLNIDTIGAGSEIANTTDKLTYVVQMTDKSANKTMDLVDASLPKIADIHQQAEVLSKQWQRFLQRELKPDEFRQLSKEIQVFLQQTQSESQLVQGNLSEIMLAQDFQDLTGQIIQKVAELVRDIEDRLVNLVAMAGTLDSLTGVAHEEPKEAVVEPPVDTAVANIAAEGPQVNTDSENVVSSQDEVDDLLSSLGF
ncbi:protein phosphatase [Bacterioplanes sanyensis]|uniref:Protein phosphatase CheZ n=1 Tax=Bacterioplanes sanyensis TaxID=1249553 RepID=A0A222FQ97_9GAMM|nr:protein phosphatase CheZ [Bacterioplanes sanyensis]ASP40571.1 protein phosphatase [Bacterioplanes sanyensis]